jgi:carbamoyl-phosphate synthase large subunit
VINTPHGSTSGGSPRLDGYEIRTACVATNIPCITTVQGLGATVQGIEALRAGNLGVRSLQSWADHGRAEQQRAPETPPDPGPGAPDEGDPA